MLRVMVLIKMHYLCSFATTVMETVLSYYRDHPGYYYYSPLFPDPIVCVRDMVMRGYVEVGAESLHWEGGVGRGGGREGGGGGEGGRGERRGRGRRGGTEACSVIT